jgi:hypothetical protein
VSIAEASKLLVSGTGWGLEASACAVMRLGAVAVVRAKIKMEEKRRSFIKCPFQNTINRPSLTARCAIAEQGRDKYMLAPNSRLAALVEGYHVSREMDVATDICCDER